MHKVGKQHSVKRNLLFQCLLLVMGRCDRNPKERESQHANPQEREAQSANPLFTD